MSKQMTSVLQWSVGTQVTFGRLNGQTLRWVVIRSRDNFRLLLSLDPIAERRMCKSTTGLWEKSELRKWLNADVSHEAFTEEEQHHLCCFGGDYLSLLSKDQLSLWDALPDCVFNCSYPWWLSSTDIYHDGDVEFHYVEQNDKQAMVRSQRADKSASVRPIIAVSLDASGESLSTDFFDYCLCPFCGTYNTNNNATCACCGFVLKRHQAVLQGKYNNTGLITAIFSSIFIVPGLIGCLAGKPMALLLIAAGLLALILGLQTRADDQRMLFAARKYSNKNDRIMPVNSSRDDEDHRKALYHNARILQKNATSTDDYTHAANMYALIADYQDAAVQREACLKAANSPTSVKS